MRRRTFLESSAGATLAVMMPSVRSHANSSTSSVRTSALGTPHEPMTLRDPKVKALASIALDAAKNAGAQYADVRLTYTTHRNFQIDRPTSSSVELGLSVRALVNGYWGWAATPYLSAQDAPRVGREAVLLANGIAAQGGPRVVDWGTIPLVADGTWTTPIRIDPFEVATEELCDWMHGESDFINDLIQVRGSQGGSTGYSLAFYKQERVLASTEGTYVIQTVYITRCGVNFKYKQQWGGVQLRAIQGGWESVLDMNVRERARQEMDRIDHSTPLPFKDHLDVGRYDIIFTAPTVASLVAATLAPATQLDRALGYEANAGGTSYLGPDPFTQLGNTVAAPLITLTADRSAPTGLATIGWDDDGVVPEDFTIIRDGVLVDYQTTREQATWLGPWYQKHGRPIRSHGCAASANALTYIAQHTPNLTLHPGPTALTFDDLITNLDHGLIVDGIGPKMDFQHLNGLGLIGGQFGTLHEVRHGKRVAQVSRADAQLGVLFRAPELWKSVIALGGPASVDMNWECTSEKGEPSQTYEYSISAVPAMIKQLAVVDSSRKAS